MFNIMGKFPEDFRKFPNSKFRGISGNFLPILNVRKIYNRRYGFCVVDKFAGKSLALAVRSEVVAMYERGSFDDGLLTNQAFAVMAVRGDRVCWLEHEDDKHCAGICKLIRCLDDLFLRLRGCLGSCHISSRSKVSGQCPHTFS